MGDIGLSSKNMPKINIYILLWVATNIIIDYLKF